MKLLWIEPKSAALIGGALCGGLGAIGAAGWVLWLWANEQASAITVGDGTPGIVMALGLILIAGPVFAAFYGALLSGLIAWLFNAIVKRTGGLELTFKE